MNLVSCIVCAVVLDKDKLHFPDKVKDDYTIDTSVAEWDGEEFKTFCICPVCKEGRIPE